MVPGNLTCQGVVFQLQKEIPRVISSVTHCHVLQCRCCPAGEEPPTEEPGGEDDDDDDDWSIVLIVVLCVVAAAVLIIVIVVACASFRKVVKKQGELTYTHTPYTHALL